MCHPHITGTETKLQKKQVIMRRWQQVTGEPKLENLGLSAIKQSLGLRKRYKIIRKKHRKVGMTAKGCFDNVINTILTPVSLMSVTRTMPQDTFYHKVSQHCTTNVQRLICCATQEHSSLLVSLGTQNIKAKRLLSKSRSNYWDAKHRSQYQSFRTSTLNRKYTSLSLIYIYLSFEINS